MTAANLRAGHRPSLCCGHQTTKAALHRPTRQYVDGSWLVNSETIPLRGRTGIGVAVEAEGADVLDDIRT